MPEERDSAGRPPLLVAVVEVGGYPDYRPLYRRAGYRVEMLTSMRKTLALLKREAPAVVVAEFNFQSDFRDRTSSLESLMAALQRHPATRVVVFYEREHAPQFERLRARFPAIRPLPFPIDEDALAEAITA